MAPDPQEATGMPHPLSEQTRRRLVLRERDGDSLIAPAILAVDRHLTALAERVDTALAGHGDSGGRPDGFGGPAWLALNQWAREVREVFGAAPYLVGSAARDFQIDHTPRDLDVVVILDDDLWEGWFGDHPGAITSHGRLLAICSAFSCWGAERVGWPVDFKLQQQTKANEQHDGPRLALGIDTGTTATAPPPGDAFIADLVAEVNAKKQAQPRPERRVYTAPDGGRCGACGLLLTAHDGCDECHPRKEAAALRPAPPPAPAAPEPAEDREALVERPDWVSEDRRAAIAARPSPTLSDAYDAPRLARQVDALIELAGAVLTDMVDAGNWNETDVDTYLTNRYALSPAARYALHTLTQQPSGAEGWTPPGEGTDAVASES